MHIYIDESGIFSNPANKNNIASCVAALAIPSSKKVKLFNDFRKLTSGWANPGEEVKGRSLNEDQIAQVISLLQRYEVILEIAAIDLGLHTQDEITAFKKRQADGVIVDIKAETNPEYARQLHQIRDTFNRMPNQLFLQSFIMFLLIPNVLKRMILYYARRIPKELKSFHWVVDAKGASVTEHERTWSIAIFPIMYTQSLNDPFSLVEGGDYSYYGRFEDSNEEALRYYEAEGNFERGEIRSVKLELILGKSFKFQDSKDNVGLQMADILANATQRAMNGKLGRKGWENIGSLMVRQRPSSFQFIKLNTEGAEKKTEVIPSPFSQVITVFKSKNKSLWLDETQEAYLHRKNRKKNSHRMRPRGMKSERRPG